MIQIQRRGLFALGAAALGLAACGQARTAPAGTVFVLVHGALHGGWCWRRVAKILRAAQADVFTPTLSGLGERSHINGPCIGLTLHIKDVVNCILAEELRRVVLVGHSYAGMVITGVAQHLGERVAHLVYLDAVIPRDGETALDAMGGLSLDPKVKMFRSKPEFDFGIKNAADLAWVRRRVTPQSALTLREKINLSRDLSTVRRTYIACTADSGTGSPADVMRRTARKRIDATWRYEELKTAHDAMISAPDDLASVLLAAAAA